MDEIIERIRKAHEQGETTLGLKGFDISELPPDIGLLANLTSLSLKQNSLRALPAEFNKLKNLRQLSLVRNDFEELPPEIFQLTNLQELFVSKNNITRLPPEIGKMRNLKILSFIRNNINEIPREIGDLTGLGSLLLTNNQITELPQEIVKLTSLKTLELRGNPLEPPLNDLAQNGIYAIMSYLLGLQHGYAFENVYSHKIKVKKELKTALHQYLVYFSDFALAAKGIEVDFNVLSTPSGLELQIRTEDYEEFQKIGKYFQEYVQLIGHKIDTLDINVESRISETEKSILLVDLRSQIRNLQTAVEIRSVKIDYLENEVSYLRRAVEKSIETPRPLYIDVTSRSDSKALAESKIDVRVELTDLQGSFGELVNAIAGYSPTLAPELQKLANHLSDLDEDITDKSQIDKGLIAKVGDTLKELSDPKSHIGKKLEGVKNGLALLQHAGRAYNSVAEWLALPQIPRLFLGINGS